jgi:hypothetical protein
MGSLPLHAKLELKSIGEIARPLPVTRILNYYPMLISFVTAPGFNCLN